MTEVMSLSRKNLVKKTKVLSQDKVLEEKWERVVNI